MRSSSCKLFPSYLPSRKDREIDQKNKASGYETLLRDGIPLNEHFLALKNKFNNEKDDLEKQKKVFEEDNKREELSNKHKRNKIEILKSEFEKIQYQLTHMKKVKQEELSR